MARASSHIEWLIIRPIQNEISLQNVYSWEALTPFEGRNLAILRYFVLPYAFRRDCRSSWRLLPKQSGKQLVMLFSFNQTGWRTMTLTIFDISITDQLQTNYFLAVNVKYAVLEIFHRAHEVLFEILLKNLLWRSDQTERSQDLHQSLNQNVNRDLSVLNATLMGNFRPTVIRSKYHVIISKYLLNKYQPARCMITVGGLSTEERSW